MIYTLDDFIKEYSNICSLGWVRTHRSGPTGIGKTLEDLLGISENNLIAPDFGDYELKSCRTNAESMLTIFTKAPWPRGATHNLLMTFGYANDAHDNNKKVLHATLSVNAFTSIADTGHGLKLVCDEAKISIMAKDGNEYAYWMKDQLKKTFERKYKKNKFVYVKAKSRGKGGDEEFQFLEAYEVSGFNYETLVDLLEQGKIFVDLRIGQYPHGVRKGKTHDHGTAFRIKESDQHLLFKINRKLV